MDENNIQSNYYAIIPAYIRYNKELKFAERLLYGEITALSNKQGYCFASNRYFANLYDVSMSTISRWISHLVELNSLHVEVIRNEKKEIVERRIYVVDNPYMRNYPHPYTQKEQYPYTQNSQYPICKKNKDNNININKIDRLFNYIINKEQKIPEEFSEIDFKEVYGLLYCYDMLYTEDIIESMQSEENKEKIKQITYTVALLVKDNWQSYCNNITRDDLISIYNECKNREKEYKGTENEIEDFTRYYYRSVVNELKRGNTSSFFVPKNQQTEEDEEER